MASRTYLYGKNPLKEALAFYARTGVNPLTEVLLTRQAEQDRDIMSSIQSHKITYSVVTSQEIESHVGRDTVHQGILALLDQKGLYTSLKDALTLCSQKERPLIVLMDELQDPHNVGAIIRSSVAFGASAIFIPEHNQTQITGTVIKSSAGMNFSIPVVQIGNINTTLLKLKSLGYWIDALTGKGDTQLPDVHFDTPVVIIVGSEGVGIAKKTLEHSDFQLTIPMHKHAESLNASNAVAVTLYEWSKQQ